MVKLIWRLSRWMDSVLALITLLDFIQIQHSTDRGVLHLGKSNLGKRVRGICSGAKEEGSCEAAYIFG